MSRKQLAQFCGEDSDAEGEKLEKIISSQDEGEDEENEAVPAEEQSPEPQKEKGDTIENWSRSS